MATTESEELFSTTPPLRLFFTAALPGAIGMLVSSIYGLMDGIFVGQYIGETAFAAINLAMPFVIVNFAFGDLIGLGSSVPISIAHGKGERDRANNIFTCACLLNVGTGLVMGLAFLVAAPAIMATMGATGELARQATLYLRVFLVSFVVRWLPFASQAFMVAVGQSRLASIVSVGQALVCPLMALVALWPLGLTGLWLNMPVASAAAGVLSLGVLGLFRCTVHERLARA